MSVLGKFKEQVVDKLPPVDSYERHDGLKCVIIDDRGLKDTERAMKSVKAILPDANIVHYRDPINSIEDHDLLLTSEGFWERHEDSYILIFQPDSLMLNRLSPLCHLFEFIGAPWDYSRFLKHNTYVGNGGFSWRDVKAASYLVKQSPYNPGKEHHEDTYFGRLLKTPSFGFAKMFSVERLQYPEPTGIHDIESHLSQKLVENILKNSDLNGIARANK